MKNTKQKIVQDVKIEVAAMEVAAVVEVNTNHIPVVLLAVQPITELQIALTKIPVVMGIEEEIIVQDLDLEEEEDVQIQEIRNKK